MTDSTSSRAMVWRAGPAVGGRVALVTIAMIALTTIGIGLKTFMFRSAAFSTNKVAITATPDGAGYWLLQQDGGIFPYGDAVGWGSGSGSGAAFPFVGMAATPDGRGFWLVGQDGGIFPYGNASGYGSIPGQGYQVRDVVGIAATPTGHGYWIVEANGGLWPYGDAPGYGCPCGSTHVTDVVAVVAVQGASGYWIEEANGGIWPYGAAGGYGSATNSQHNQPFTGMVATPVGTYWMVGGDGGIYQFPVTGSTPPFYGSLPGRGLGVTDVSGIATTGDGRGYWVVEQNGSVRAFGDAACFTIAASC